MISRLERSADVMFVAGMLAVIASFFVPDSPARGWLTLSGFSVFALQMVLRPVPGERKRVATARSIYMLVTAATLSLPYLWSHEPQWVKWMLTDTVLLVVTLLLIEQKRAASVGGSFTAPLRVPLRPARIVRFGVIFVLLALLPAVFFWIRR